MKARVPRRFADLLVEREIPTAKPLQISSFRGGEATSCRLADERDIRVAAALRNDLGRKRLERLPCLVRVLDGATRRKRHAPPPPAGGLDQADLPQLEQGLADGRLADVQLLCQRRLGHARARRNHPVDDRDADLLVYDVSQTLGLVLKHKAL